MRRTGEFRRRAAHTAFVVMQASGLVTYLGAQGLPSLPAGVPDREAPSVPELLPLRPFSLDVEGGDGRSLRWRGERVMEDGEAWVIENGAIQSEDLLLLADRIRYEPRTGMLEAQGRIRLEGPDLRLRCERLRMDWRKRIGDAWALELEVPPSWTLRSGHVAFATLKSWAFESVEISPCPQETPGWSAKLSSMQLEIEGFATFRHARILVGGIPVLYLPWAAYPAKAERSSGLLPPQIGYSTRLGTLLGLSYYQVLGNTLDATFAPQIYSREGVLWGGELRWNPELTHTGSFQGQFIKQRSDDQHRYRYKFQELWQREDGWQFSADLNQASDNLVESDYGQGATGLGTTSFDSAVFLGRNFPWASVSLAAAEQRSFFLSEDSFYRPDFPSSLRRQTLPQLQVRLYPRPIGDFYLDGSAGLSRFAYRLDLGKGSENPAYAWWRSDWEARTHGRLGQLGPFRADLQLALRYTRYSASLQESVFDANGTSDGQALDPSANPLLDPFRVDGAMVQRILGSGRLQFSGPQLGRTFEKLSLLGYSGDVKHVLEPFVAFTKNSESSQAGKIPRFDEVDSRPGVGYSTDGEQSVEIGLKQHLLGRAGKGYGFADLVRWRIATRYQTRPILLPDGRFKRGWGSLDNDIDVEPNDRFRVSFRRSSEISGTGAADSSLTAEYTARSGSRFNLALFSTGINPFLVRQQGVQAGGLHRFFDDQWRLEYQANYDIHLKGFSFSQVALAYITPCVAARLRYSHLAIPVAGALNKEDRLDLVLTLRGLGDLFSLRQ